MTLYGQQLSQQFAELRALAPIRLERFIAVSPSVLWSALTERSQLSQWFRSLPQFEAQVGFEFSFADALADGKKYGHRCRILAVVPSRLLRYAWQSDNSPGYSEVTFELSPTAGGTHLSVLHEGIETFIETHFFSKERFEMAWTRMIDRALSEYLSRL